MSVLSDSQTKKKNSLRFLRQRQNRLDLNFIAHFSVSDQHTEITWTLHRTIDLCREYKSSLFAFRAICSGSLLCLKFSPKSDMRIEAGTRAKGPRCMEISPGVPEIESETTAASFWSPRSAAIVLASRRAHVTSFLSGAAESTKWSYCPLLHFRSFNLADLHF